MKITWALAQRSPDSFLKQSNEACETSLEIWHRPPECLKTPMQTTKNLQVESVSNSRHVLVCQWHQELPQHLWRSMCHVAWIEVEWASHGVGIAWHHLACHLDFFQLSVTALKHLTHPQIQLRALCQKECRSTAKKINSPEALTVWIKHNSSWSTSALMSFSGLRRSAPWLLLHFFVHQNLHAISLLARLDWPLNESAHSKKTTYPWISKAATLRQALFCFKRSLAMGHITKHLLGPWFCILSFQK